MRCVIINNYRIVRSYGENILAKDQTYPLLEGNSAILQARRMPTKTPARRRTFTVNKSLTSPNE